MAKVDNTLRENAAALRAIEHGFIVMKILGREDLPYYVWTESGLGLDQVEELLDELDKARGVRS